MELMIDNQPCDLPSESMAVAGFDGSQLADLDAARVGRKLTLALPATPTNHALFGCTADPHAASRFNESLHHAELCAEGAILLGGTVRLLSSSTTEYRIEIRSGGADWATTAAQRMFNALALDYSSALTPTAICESWTAETPVRFLPIVRDSYQQQNSSTDLLPAERFLSVDDYHPFLQIAAIVKQLFTDAGYRVESRFFESEFFRSLYMSGAYATQDCTAAINRMGFSARRLSAVTATANYMGRVSANPNTTYNSVGNLVESATPQSIDADGAAVSGLYNNGTCFTIDAGRIVYTPPTEVNVGFEYYLKYTTEHRILSRTRLKGFDSIYLGAGSLMNFELANRYTDCRAEIAANHAYRVLVFDHTTGAKYRLLYRLNGVANTLWSSFSERSAIVTTPTTGRVDSPQLQIQSGSAWIAYTGDWALYDGYIGETGETTVEVRLRSVAETISPQAPKHFDQIYFSGADPEMRITLDKSCSLQPDFRSGVGFGSHILFTDIAQHRIRQSLLLEALAHLFNLRFYTDEATKTVQIEPADAFYDPSCEVDWSAKTDFSHAVVRTEITPEIHERRTWSYLSGDGAVARYNASAEQDFGAWSFRSNSYATLRGEQQLQNPLFCPSFNTTGCYLNAPSAQLLQVGDRDDAAQDGTNFTPRIVRFVGIHPLPVGERWGYPANSEHYPLAAFYFGGDDHLAGFSLGFEDREGIEGLHRYYDRQICQEERRERISLWLHITPAEFEAIFIPSLEGVATLRSTFRLDTGAGIVRATLHRIESYNPDSSSVCCTFNRIPED